MSRATGSDAVVFLTGDVMTGRGIDQILPHPGDPTLRESVVSDARTYVRLAERTNGPVPAPVDVSWPWGDALSILDDMNPDVRVLNLETSVTTSSEFAPRKAVHYRMHPHNIGCLSSIRPDVCVLANNHSLDFGHGGLAETLRVVGHETRCAGAGSDIHAAERPVIVQIAGGTRAVVSAIGFPSSGIPLGWGATDSRPGLALVSESSDRAATAVAGRTLAEKRPGDIAVVSMHWGSNWGYEVDEAQIRFAHRLIDEGIDVVHGHSSHHPRPIEVYRGKLILYGCGDTIDDYEGIATYEAFRHELRLLYFASIDRHSGRLTQLTLVPMRMRRMRLERAARADAEWLRASVERMSARFETRLRGEPNGALTVVW
ncbi:CapA family protein [Mycolicibacterium celeriflavum]|uniref:CapA family protein n=1 Tax=Mycolicibacterium celeriflavum TaxID=1249101 RepID=UPI0009ECE60F|nr:CapA family protein [Mycolicibacterium celeriflavum]